MTKSILYLFAFFIPLNGLLYSFIGVKIAPALAFLLLVLRLAHTSKIILSKTVAICVFLFISFLMLQMIREDSVLILIMSFFYYLLIGVIFGTYSNKRTLDLFYAAYLHGVILSCLIFFAALTNVGVSNSIVQWNYGIPVNLSGIPNPNGWAPFLLLAIAANDYVYCEKKGMGSLFSQHFCFQAIIIISLLLTHSRAALLGLVVYFVLVNFKSILKIRYLLPIFLLGAGYVGLGVIDVGIEERGSITANKSGSVEVRKEILEGAIEVAGNNILFGNGYGSSQDVMENLTGWHVSLHNSFLATLIEMGIFQFALLIIICAYPFYWLIVTNRLHLMIRSKIRYIIFILLANLIFWNFHEGHINTAFWAFYFCLLRQISGEIQEDSPTALVK